MKEFIEKMTKRQKIITLVIFIIILGVFFLLYNYFYNSNEEIIYTNESSVDEKWNEISGTSFAKKEGIIVIDIVGEVNNPGVVTLEEGARIIDAINAAGGKTDRADLSEINLAYILDDGIRLYIPSFSEMKEKRIENSTNKETISESIGITNIIQESAEKEVNNTQSNKVNINKANLDELKKLPGIGDSVAQAIIAYRTKNGAFKKIEDLKAVPGIGDSKFKNIEKLISIK